MLQGLQTASLMVALASAGCAASPPQQTTAQADTTQGNSTNGAAANMANEVLAIEIEVLAPRERVWQAWVNPAQLKQWLTEDANVDMQTGGLYELFWEPEHRDRNSTLGCRLTEVKNQELLSFSWKGPVPYADLMNREPLPTSVSVVFQSVGTDRTKLRLEHKGWGTGPRWSEARQWQEQAWRKAFEALKQLLEH